MNKTLPVTGGRIWVVTLCAVFVLICTVTGAHAAYVFITPTTSTQWSGQNMGGDKEIADYMFDEYRITLEDLLYKADVAIPPIESGPYAGSYDTAFVPPTDPSNATITWDGPSFMTGAEYLVVKDGNATPGWFVFDLMKLVNVWVDPDAPGGGQDAVWVKDYSWNGMDALVMQDFWAGTGVKGSISHVSIYGVVPEPASLAVWSALGVIFGIGLYRRRRGQR